VYNPENLDLPAHDDRRLTDYTYGYDVLFVHVLAFNSDDHEETPIVDIEFQTPFKVNVPFHFMMWPDTPKTIEFEEFLDIEHLNPKSSSYASTKAKVLKLMGVDPKEGWQPSLTRWREEALDGGCDRLAIVRYRVRYEWTVRAWKGLTLQHLQSEMDSVEWSLDFVKDFEVPEGTLLLETTEPEDLKQRPKTLQVEFPISPTKLEVNSLPVSVDVNQSRRLSAGLWSRLKSRFRF
jgi:hypothetical protein